MARTVIVKLKVDEDGMDEGTLDYVEKVIDKDPRLKVDFGMIWDGYNQDDANSQIKLDLLQLIDQCL